MKNADKLMKFI